MEKIKYSGECELKTRTAYQQGCFFPTMLRIQEVCYERNTDNHYSIKCLTHYDYFIMDGECHEEQVSISRVLKYHDILEHIDIETAYKLKNKYNI